MMRLAAAAALALALTACRAKAPRPLNYGTDECSWCRMALADSRWGGELVTRHGKLYVFDTVECLASFYVAQSVPARDVDSLWVVHFTEPGRLIPASAAIYLRTERVRSAMGQNLAALSSPEEVARLGVIYGGEAMSWEQVLSMIRQGRMNVPGPVHRPSSPRQPGGG